MPADGVGVDARLARTSVGGDATAVSVVARCTMAGFVAFQLASLRAQPEFVFAVQVSDGSHLTPTTATAATATATTAAHVY